MSKTKNPITHNIFFMILKISPILPPYVFNGQDELDIDANLVNLGNAFNI